MVALLGAQCRQLCTYWWTCSSLQLTSRPPAPGSAIGCRSESLGRNIIKVSYVIVGAFGTCIKMLVELLEKVALR